jgi:hypothetical protein
MATLITGPRKSGRSLLGRIFVRKTGGRLFDNAESHEEEALFHAWNDAQSRRKPLLIVADAPPPRWQVALPDLRSRLAATPQVEIGPPDDFLIGQLIVKLLGDRGIAAPPLVYVLSHFDMLVDILGATVGPPLGGHDDFSFKIRLHPAERTF